MVASFGISTRAPEPPKADFALYIDFDKGAERPQRVFKALDGAISALERLDRALVASISPSIEPVLLLEDIEAGSLKVWLRDRLREIDDQAIYKIEWRPILGRYLVAAKYAYIQWFDENPSKGSLSDLRKRIALLAAETDISKMAGYSPPSASELIGSAGELSRAIGNLSPTDKMSFLSEQGDHNFRLDAVWDEETIRDLSVREAISMPPAPMILAVRRPDYLGLSQWEFRHGSRTIRAKIEDQDWLARFQSREIDVRPGDALRCEVAVTVAYGYDNELVSETYLIKRVVDVLESEAPPPILPFSGSS